VEQAERRHGGYRLGAGRKSKYGVKTVVMRIPENRVQEVKNLIGGGGLESVTESKAKPIEDIRRIIERWGGRSLCPIRTLAARSSRKSAGASVLPPVHMPSAASEVISRPWRSKVIM
jgi:hypothetical protein